MSDYLLNELNTSFSTQNAVNDTTTNIRPTAMTI